MVNYILEASSTGCESLAGPMRAGPASGKRAWVSGVFMLDLKLFQLNGIVPISDSFKKMDIMKTISFLQIILIMSK